MVVAAHEVKFSIGRETILDHVSMEVEEGSFFALFGPDDSGKTTFLNLLCGFSRPDEGTIELCGKNPYAEMATGQGMRHVPEDVIMEDCLTGGGYLKFCKENSLYYKEEIEQELCEMFQLPLGERLTSMTYGENKMIQIVGAVSAMPELLVLDEPRIYLDKDTYRKLLNCLEHLSRRGMTILMAVETYAEVRSFCTHYAYIKEGKIVSSAKVPTPDYRKKVVIMDEKRAAVVNGNGEDLPWMMEKCIAVRRGKAYYLFSGNSRQLGNAVLKADSEDVVVEEMTLEEELDCNYSRWM